MTTPAVTYPKLTNTGANDANKVNANFGAIVSGLVDGTWGVSFKSISITDSIKSATNLAGGWWRIATAPAGNNVGLFRITHIGQTKKSTLVFTLSQAQGSTKPNINILATDASDR